MNGFLESNREELENNAWLSLGYIPKKGLSAAGKLTKDTSRNMLRRLLSENTTQISMDSQKEKQKDSAIAIPQKAKMADDSHCQIRRAAKSPLNSQQLHKIINPNKKISKSETLKGSFLLRDKIKV